MLMTCLLKRAVPFTLTFILGAAAGGFFKLFGADAYTRAPKGSFVLRGYESGRGCDYRRKLLAESKPLVILFKPDARWPRGLEMGRMKDRPARVLVTFGADGKVGEVEPVGAWYARGRVGTSMPVWEAVEGAARLIRFTPETINSVPVSVTKEIDIRFLSE